MDSNGFIWGLVGQFVVYGKNKGSGVNVFVVFEYDGN